MALPKKRLFSKNVFSSSTQDIPDADDLPKHIAIIMDGNGRWARKRLLPRVAGHKKGVEVVRQLVKECARLEVGYLTLFAFSSENWRRPKEEVSFLMGLFMEALKREVEKLHENNIRLILIGDRSAFSQELNQQITASEEMTEHNTGLTLTIAANYGGRWDMLQAANKVMQNKQNQTLTEEDLSACLSMHYAPEPDLFIRTGGEQRISNFLLWQLAYTELYFTNTLWPDFDTEALQSAIHSYQKRERRFGRTGEQVQEQA